MFYQNSTLYINIKKSEIAWIAPEKQRSEQQLKNMENFKCVDLDKEAIKILGINFTYNTNLFNKLNFERVEENLTRTLNIWRQQNLTIYMVNVKLYAHLQFQRFFMLPKYCVLKLNLLSKISFVTLSGIERDQK